MKNRWIPYALSFLFFFIGSYYGIRGYHDIESSMSSPTFEILAKSNFNFLSAMTVDQIVLEDKKSLEGFIDQALSHDWGIKMIRFEDRHGDILGEWEDKKWSKIQKLLETENGRKGYYFLKSPVIIQGESFGSISIGYDFRAMESFSVERSQKIQKLGLTVLLILMTGMPAPFLIYDQWSFLDSIFQKVKGFFLKFKKKPES